MAKLGLTTYFGSLSEVIAKNNESINYIGSRLDSIISTLRGATSKADIDLSSGESTINSPETQAVQQALQNQKDKDQQRKQVRKDQQDAQLDAATTLSTPTLNVQELQNAPAPKVV